jgi:hypothetical protein
MTRARPSDLPYAGTAAEKQIPANTSRIAPNQKALSDAGFLLRFIDQRLAKIAIKSRPASTETPHTI